MTTLCRWACSFVGLVPVPLTVQLATAQQEPGQQVPAPKVADGQAAATAAAGLRYRVAEWPRGDRRAGVRLDQVEVRGLGGGAIESGAPGSTMRRFGDAERDRVEVEVLVRDSVELAQRDVLGWLAHVSRPDDVPTAAKEGMPVGDVGFVGWSRKAERRVSWLAFVRDNVAVRVHCLEPGADPHPDLAAIAQAVDAAIAREARVAAPQPLPCPTVDAFALAGAKCAAGDVLPVVLRVRDDAGITNVRFQFDGPGQAYVEGDLQRGYTLHTTGAGSLTVRVFVTGARGVAAESRVALEIGPRG